MARNLIEEVTERLDSSGLAPPADWLALAALLGDDALEQALGGTAPERPAATEATHAAPSAVYLDSLTVAGFRGVGDEVELKLPPGPGLTLVVGPNGSGKSSFAEALEFLFTKDNYRWHDRAKVWREGWRNLHHPHDVHLSARVAVDGQPRTTTIACRWADGAGLEDTQIDVTRPDGQTTPYGDHPWSRAVQVHRPFLSYNELGGLLDERPSALYDAVAAALGLDDLVESRERLRQQRLARSKQVKEAKGALTGLLAALDGSTDERAGRCRQALSSRVWDLDVVESVLTEADVDAGSDLDVLGRLAALEGPDRAFLDDLSNRLRDAAAAVAALAGTDADAARRRAALLQQALDLHEHHGDSECPVCGVGSLDAAWRDAALGQVAELQREADAADAAHDRLDRTAREARALLRPPPDVVADVDRIGLGVPVAPTWAEWSGLDPGADPAALAAHLETVGPRFIDVLDETRQAAAARRDQVQDEWRPLARDLLEWLPDGRDAVANGEMVGHVEAAEKWLQRTVGEIRDERFDPIAEQVIEHWSLLRLNSSVEIRAVALEGTTTNRRLEIEVAVDDMESSALGVMSQGEIHSLSLCLFLPRATSAQSPFRFVAIDDPVQSMDPARVDGLARLLAATAEQHQVVVFTHDDRLPEAARRLRLGAHVIEVRRRLRSQVELRVSEHPVERYLSDARALAKTPEVPPSLMVRLVPTLCRDALEAACLEVLRRRRLADGAPHREIEDLWAQNPRLVSRLALALFDDPGRHDEVLDHIENRFGRDTAVAVRLCNRGSHGTLAADLDVPGFVRPIQKLANELLDQP